jgi:hypothetical protein
VKVWDSVTGQETLTLKGHAGKVYSVAFSPDGSRLASASWDGTVKVWDSVTGQETLTLKGHAGKVYSVAFSPDGARIASASGDATVKVWDAREATAAMLARDEARALILHQAEAIVGRLFARLFLRDDVLAVLQAQPAADPEIQATCLKLAETWIESAEQCNAAGWALVRDPGRPLAIYERGLRLAEAACQLEPETAAYLTLGVAQYRAGLMAESLATLTRSSSLQFESKPEYLAFLAMTHHRLGHSEDARALLDRLRNRIRQSRVLTAGQAVENRAFLAEAEAVILFDPIFPANPFAP